MKPCPIEDLCDHRGCPVPEHDQFQQPLGDGVLKVYCPQRKSYIKITTRDMFEDK